ncbi:MAG: hypothetical protein ACKPHU_01025, partial [Planctomycetaceae bacterium]
CIARRADYIPFYMATVVTHLTAHPRPICYRDSTNDANGQPVPDARIASELLDHFASVSQPQSIDQVWTAHTCKSHSAASPLPCRY